MVLHRFWGLDEATVLQDFPAIKKSRYEDLQEAAAAQPGPVIPAIWQLGDWTDMEQVKQRDMQSTLNIIELRFQLIKLLQSYMIWWVMYEDTSRGLKKD